MPIGENSSLVYSAADRLGRIISNHLALLLDRCRTFKTLEDHAIKCTQDFALSHAGAGLPSFSAIRRHLSALADAGLLISEMAILRQCQQAGELLPSIASVGVITRNRIDSLRRGLISYLENGRKYARTNDYVVMDDSEAAGARARTRTMLSLLEREYGV